MRISIATSCLALVLFSVAANAADGADAAIERGLRFMGVGEYDHALREFLEAKHLDPTPRTNAQIAIAEQALEHFVDAEIHLMDVLQAADDPWVKAHHDELEQSLTAIRAELGSLVVRGKPYGAGVRLDSELVGKVPMRRPARLRKGKVTVQVEAAGFATKVQDVQVIAGQTATVDVDLAPSVATVQPPRPPPAAIRPSLPPPVAAPVPAPAPSSVASDPHRSDRLVGWAYVAAGALSMAAGGYLWAYGKPGMGGQDIGKALVGAGAVAFVASSVVIVADWPVVNSKNVSLAGPLDGGWSLLTRTAQNYRRGDVGAWV